MFQIDEEINHETFGKGVIIFSEERTDCYGNPHMYLDVHFENDPKYQIRRFTPESLKEHLVK